MKLLLCAILADSLIEMEQADWLKGDIASAVADVGLRGSSRSLHRRIGSDNRSQHLQVSFDVPCSQFGCFQFSAVHMLGLLEVNTKDLMKSGLCCFDDLA